jgi:hypothetical protein
LVTPRPKNTETLVSIVPSPHEQDVRIKHERKLFGAFKMMADRGIKFTSYTVTDGAGRPMREEEEEE